MTHLLTARLDIAQQPICASQHINFFYSQCYFLSFADFLRGQQLIRLACSSEAEASVFPIRYTYRGVV